MAAEKRKPKTPKRPRSTEEDAAKDPQKRRGGEKRKSLEQRNRSDKKKRQKKGSAGSNANADFAATSAPKVEVDILKIRFLKWEISSISCMAVSPDGNFVVTARRSGCIELRQKQSNWQTTFILRWNVSDETAAVSALAFDSSGDYLLVGRFNGHLDVYSVSPEGLAHHVRVEPGGGSVLSMASRPFGPFEVAVGCEDGRVRFLRVDDEFTNLNVPKKKENQLPRDANHYSVLRGTRSDGLCLSLDWKSNGPDDAGIIVCGDSLSGLRWINGSTKEVVGRSHAPTLNLDRQIWTTQIVANGSQVVCGDSRGMVSVWCSKTYTKIEENQIEGMAGDIWCAGVVQNSDGTETVLLGCAGGTVASMTSLVSANGSVSWMPCRGRIVHSHDVRNIGVLGNNGFVTSSLDSRLCFFANTDVKLKSSGMFVLPYQGAAGQNPIQILREPSLIVNRKQFEVDLWSTENGSVKDPTLALRIKRPDVLGGFVSCGVSGDASMVAMSNVEGFAIYDLEKANVESDTDSPLFAKVTPRAIDSAVNKSFKGAEQLSVLKDVILGISRNLQSLLILIGDKLLTISKKEIRSKALFLTHVTCNPQSGSIVLVDSRGCIFLANINGVEQDGFQHIASLGQDKGVSCIECSRSGQTLVVALLDATLAVIPLTKENPSIGITQPFPSVPNTLSFSVSENSVLASGRDFCYVVSWKSSRRGGSRITKLKKDVRNIVWNSSVLTSGIVSPSVICVIQRNWETEFNQLPSVLPRKIYGF